jgi:hypothetical protein
MKGFNIFLVIFLILGGCKEEKKQSGSEEKEVTEEQVEVFGANFDRQEVQNSRDISSLYSSLSESDTLKTSFKAVVTDVCKAKGCWMKVSLENGQETMVTFKDYGFFVPKDIVGKEVAMHGMGFIEQQSVEDQRHYARDGGIPEEEVMKITDPKVIYSFVADGVLLFQ